MMVKLGNERLAEIQRIEDILYMKFRVIMVENGRHLSYTEVLAAMIRAVERIAKSPAEEVRESARKLTDEWAPQSSAMLAARSASLKSEGE